MKILKKKKTILLRIFALVLFFSFNPIIIGVSSFTIANEDGSCNGIESYYDGPTESWVEDHRDRPTGTRFTVFEEHGGYWADAEKSPGSDGSGNPGPNNPGDEDDMQCWAATASNMLEYTGWGFVEDMTYGNTDDFFKFFQDHTEDVGYTAEAGLKWWFDGEIGIEDVDHTGFWEVYTPSDYIDSHTEDNTTLPYLHFAMAWGRVTGLAIGWSGFGGHAVTCWGVNHDEDLAWDSKEKYKGVWITDSDSHRTEKYPDDVLRYYEVKYDHDNDRWYMPSFSNAFIYRVYSLGLFPGEDRPVAEISVEFKGSRRFTFDARGSSDRSGDELKYRWDFNGDGRWDTRWISDSKINHKYNIDDPNKVKVYLEVFDGRLRDIAIKTVEIQPISPIPIYPIHPIYPIQPSFTSISCKTL